MKAAKVKKHTTHTKKNGFSHVMIPLAILIAVMVVGAGVLVYEHQNKVSAANWTYIGSNGTLGVNAWACKTLVAYSATYGYSYIVRAEFTKGVKGYPYPSGNPAYALGVGVIGSTGTYTKILSNQSSSYYSNGVGYLTASAYVYPKLNERFQLSIGSTSAFNGGGYDTFYGPLSVSSVGSC